MNHKIIVRDILGRYCVTIKDGQTLYNIILPILQAKEKVTLDFSGVEIYASPFMNVAFGQLLRDFLPDELNALLIIDRDAMTPVGFSILSRVIENAKAYYEDDKVKKAVDEVLDIEPESGE